MRVFTGMAGRISLCGKIECFGSGIAGKDIGISFEQGEVGTLDAIQEKNLSA